MQASTNDVLFKLSAANSHNNNNNNNNKNKSSERNKKSHNSRPTENHGTDAKMLVVAWRNNFFYNHLKNEFDRTAMWECDFFLFFLDIHLFQGQIRFISSHF